MNVNEKGVKGLIKVLDDVSDRGLYAFPAFDDHSPVDVVVMTRDGRMFRLQVKYREPMANKTVERYELHARSMVNGKAVPIDRSLIDGWAVYLQGRNCVMYIPTAAMEGKKSLVIDPDKDYGAWAGW